MRYKLMGRSGLRVSELALGTMTFGEDWGWGAGRDECARIFDTYAKAGGNFIDTANRYTEGTAEKLVGDLIAADRDHFVVASKYTLFNRRGDPNASGSHRKNMMASLESSLKRLKTSYIDLFLVHAWDYFTPVEEVVRGLDDLVRSGKILYAGISDSPAWVVSRADMLAELRGWSPFVGLQLRYSLADRAAERDLLPMARALDIGVSAWSVLGAGVLTGKYNSGSSGQAEGRVASWGGPRARDLAIAQEVSSVAEETGHSASQVAINWVRQQPGGIIPILGTRHQSQLEDNLGCLAFELSEDQLQRLDEVSRIDLGFPHDFLASDEIRDLVYGGTFGDIDNHRA
jgi:aryl-alcohol dehydrogenase-like predicted oxidoreductase